MWRVGGGEAVVRRVVERRRRVWGRNERGGRCIVVCIEWRYGEAEKINES